MDADPGRLIAGRDMVVLAAAGLVAAGVTGRDAVDEADAGLALAAAPAGARIPVLEAADAGVAPGRIPVETSAPWFAGFEKGAAGDGAGVAAPPGADVAAPVPPAGSVVPHCTQNFAPG